MNTCEDKASFIARMAKAENLKWVNEHSKEVTAKKGFYLTHVKRIIDIAVAFPAFILLLPINMLLAVLTWLDVGPPIFFHQERTGIRGKKFYLTKFRNMTNAKDEHGNLLPPNERVTAFGKFVRKYSLDELLNFWSILKGDMSLIGPRPLPSSFDERYSNRHKKRNLVKPGLECPSLDQGHQVRFYHEQFENDIWYVEHVSFLVDCQMVLALFRMVFNAKERGDHATVGGGDFLGYDENGRAFSMRHIPEKYEKVYQTYVENYATNASAMEEKNESFTER